MWHVGIVGGSVVHVPSAALKVLKAIMSLIGCWKVLYVRYVAKEKDAARGVGEIEVKVRMLRWCYVGLPGMPGFDTTQQVDGSRELDSYSLPDSCTGRKMRET